MYSVTVRDHFMIAHSFRGEVFGPARQLHGATYVVDLELRRPELDVDGLVVDIGLAAAALHAVLAEFNYRNLDKEASLAGKNTTTEVLAREIFERMAQQIHSGALGRSAQGLVSMRVTLHESHIAWAAFEGELSSQPPG